MVLDGERLEWATLVQSGERFRRVDQGVEILSSEPDSATGEAGDARTAVIERIRAACGDAKGDMALGMPSTSVLLRVVELPLVDDTELAEMVELQADKFSPFPVETMAVSHEIVARDDSSCRVLVAAARDDAVDAQGSLLVEAGLRPAGIDSCSLGWWRLLQDAGGVPSEGRAVLLVVPGSVVELIVVQDGVPLVFRSLELDSGMAPADVAVEIEQELSHTLMSIELEHGSQPVALGLWAYEDQLPVLGAALNRGGGWDVDEHPLDPLPPLCEGIARRLLAGGGIDLTPHSWLDADAARSRRRAMLGGLAGVLGLWLICVLALVGLFGWRRTTISRLQARRQTWEQPAMAVRELRSRVLMIDRYTDMSHSSLECLREISSIQPEGIDLASFTYTKGDTIRIVGRASMQGRIYAFKEALDASGLFPHVALGSLIQDRRRKHWNFDLVLKLTGDEEAS
jgi:hypothetical protein